MVAVDILQSVYEDMVTVRHYEERLQEEYLEGKQPAFDSSAGPIPGELHLAAGHEASGAGVCHHLRDDNTVTAPHRPHHVAIAKGIDLKRMTAEIFGRETGLCRGKGGHMHLFDPDVNFACSGIIAEGCPPAVGAGLAAKKRNTDSVAAADAWPDDADAEEGVVVNWFAGDGSRVEAGDDLCEFQVEKVSVDVPAPASGTPDEIVRVESTVWKTGGVPYESFISPWAVHSPRIEDLVV